MPRNHPQFYGRLFSRTTRLLFLPALLLALLACPASAKQIELWSEPVSEGFGQVPPMKIDLGKGASSLEKAGLIPVIVAAYGSGRDIHVDLVLADPLAEVTQAELVRTVMAAAFTFCQIIQSEDADEDRAVRANLYPVYTNSYEYNVVLASAVIKPVSNNPARFMFPGPAWERVVAAERGCTELELSYLQQMQLKRYAWGGKESDIEQENMRKNITPEQDAEISKILGIKPGTIHLAPLVLKPLAE